jgi:voltage-gated potassium channel
VSWNGTALNVAELMDGGDHGAMRITAPIRLQPAAIRAREPHFPLFLMAALLPLLLFPFADLDGTPLQRLMLPLAVTVLVVESLLALPSWVARIGPLQVNALYRLLGLFSALAVWWPLVTAHRPPFGWHVLILAVRSAFYLLTAVRIIQVLANSDRVSVRTLCLGAAGYVHLGLTAGLLATVLQMVDTDSFNINMAGLHEELMARLSYFAFVTISSLGYGDVVPASPVGEVFAVLVSISSTLYISLLIGLLLSRFIASQSPRRRSRQVLEDSP